MSIDHKDKLVEGLSAGAAKGKLKRKSSKTKNELFREQFLQAIHNEVVFSAVLGDIWFGNVKNMELITSKSKEFIMSLKTNRQVSLYGEQGQENKEYVPVESLELEGGMPVKVWLKGYSKPLLLCKQVFKNKDNSIGILYLVASDGGHLLRYYHNHQRRWAVETYHRSLKNNTSVCASPTKTIKTQCNHIYASVMAFVKLEVLKVKKEVNQYALKSKLYLKGMQSAFDELRNIKAGVQLDLNF